MRKSKKSKNLPYQAKKESAVASNDETLVLTPEEVRQRLKISRSVLYSALRQGTIPCIKISPRKILIPKHRFLEWLNKGGGDNLHPHE